MTRLVRTTATCALAFGLLAPPAAAAHKPKPKPKYTYTATIDCGAGPLVVDSTDDMFAPLRARVGGKLYQPVKWRVKVGKKTIRATKPGWHGGRTVNCSYDDGQAVGTVTVKAPAAKPKPKPKSKRKS